MALAVRRNETHEESMSGRAGVRGMTLERRRRRRRRRRRGRLDMESNRRIEGLERAPSLLNEEREFSLSTLISLFVCQSVCRTDKTEGEGMGKRKSNYKRH